MKVFEREIEKHDEQALTKINKLEASKERQKKNKENKSKNGEDKPETSNKNYGGHVNNQNKKKTFKKKEGLILLLREGGTLYK